MTEESKPEDPALRRAHLAYEELEKKLAHALATGDFSIITTAVERCSLAWRLSHNRDWARAEQVARSIADDPDERGQAFAILAQDLAGAGDPARAEQLAAEIPDDPQFFGALHEKTEALLASARSFASLDRPADAARALASAVRSAATLEPHGTWETADCLFEAALAYRGLGLHAEALGCLEAALRSANGPRHNHDCEKVKARIAIQLAELGHLDDANEVARSIAIPAARLRTLLRLQTEYTQCE